MRNPAHSLSITLPSFTLSTTNLSLNKKNKIKAKHFFFHKKKKKKMVRVWPKNAQSRATHIVESSHSPIRTTTPTSFLPSLLRALPIYDSLERENRFHLEREKAMVDADALWETKRFSYSVSRLNFGGMWGFSFFILWGIFFFFFFQKLNWIYFILGVFSERVIWIGGFLRWHVCVIEIVS